MGKLWKAFSGLADVIQVASFGGLTLGSLVGGITLIAGYLSEVPLFWMLVGAAFLAWTTIFLFDRFHLFQKAAVRMPPLVAAGVADKQVSPADSQAAQQIVETTYLTANQVVHYLADESQWGAQKAAEVTPDGLRRNALLEAPIEFQNRTAEGKVRVYGANSITGTHELIPKTFWMSCGLDYATVFNPEESSRTAPTTYAAGYASVRSGVPQYSDLRIEAADVYATWPLSVERQHAQYDAAFTIAAMSKNEARKELWRLREEGVAIRNEPVSSEQTFPLWKQKYEGWRNTVLEVAEKYDENLRPRLEVLDRPRLPPNLPVVNRDHALCITVASEILLRIDENLPRP